MEADKRPPTSETGWVGKVEWVKVTCTVCGKQWEVQPSVFKRRMKVTKSGKLFCSRRCSITHRDRDK